MAAWLFVTVATMTIALIGCGMDTMAPIDDGGTVDTGDDTIGQDDPPDSRAKFDSPLNCAGCHPKHHEEWQGSVMHYAAESPVFNAFELTVQKLTDGLFANNGQHANLCIECHSPTGVFDQELPDFVGPEEQKPARDSLSAVNREGISCDFCHTVTGPDLESSTLGDGIANVSLEFAPSNTKMGPIADPVKSTYHTSSQTDFLSSANFCGGCHDVRLPFEDTDTGEPFQRLENLFTEWQEGPYNSTDNPHGRVVTCQDCHMSLYPMTEPGVRPMMKIAATPEAPERSHAIHAFTAVSFPVIDDERFPNVDTDEVDEFGYPKGQKQRREQMLKAACTLTLQGTPESIDVDDDVLSVAVVVTNTGAGHRVPSGFSQERQVWIELTVEDDDGLIYESGFLRDKPHPETGERIADGLLDDEDLEDRHIHIDPDTLEATVQPGPDINQRPEVNLGLVNFQNAFIRVHEDGTREEVVSPLLATTMDNSRSLPMLEPQTYRYDIPLPEREINGNIRVAARLRYRAFPPEFLRILAIREPQLVDEDIVDRNTIVDMATAQTTIEVR